MTEAIAIQPPGVDRFPVRQPLPKDRFNPPAKETFTVKKQPSVVVSGHKHTADFTAPARGLFVGTRKVVVFQGRP